MISADTLSTLMNQKSQAATGALSLGTASGGLARKAMNEAQAATAAKDFESMFIGQMMEPMFGDSVGDEMFGDEETSEIYKGLMVDQYGKLISKSGGIGIADHVKQELMRLQEVKP